MFNKLKSLLVVLMLVLIGACADFDDNGGSGGSGGSGGGSVFSPTLDLGTSFKIASLGDGNVFEKSGSDVLSYTAAEINPVNKNDTIIKDQLETELQLGLEQINQDIGSSGVTVTTSVISSEGTVAAGETFTVKIHTRIIEKYNNNNTDTNVYTFAITFSEETTSELNFDLGEGFKIASLGDVETFTPTVGDILKYKATNINSVSKDLATIKSQLGTNVQSTLESMNEGSTVTIGSVTSIAPNNEVGASKTLIVSVEATIADNIDSSNKLTKTYEFKIEFNDKNHAELVFNLGSDFFIASLGVGKTFTQDRGSILKYTATSIESSGKNEETILSELKTAIDTKLQLVNNGATVTVNNPIKVSGTIGISEVLTITAKTTMRYDQGSLEERTYTFKIRFASKPILKEDFDLGTDFTINSLNGENFINALDNPLQYSVTELYAKLINKDTVVAELKTAIRNKLDSKYIVSFGIDKIEGDAIADSTLVVTTSTTLKDKTDTFNSKTESHVFTIMFHEAIEPWDSISKIVTEDNNVYNIENGGHLAWIAEQSANDNFTGKTIMFINHIDMNNKEFEGIKLFKGTIDGNGKKIYNLKIKTTDEFVGLVSKLEGEGLIKNLTIASGEIEGAGYVGAFVGRVAVDSSRYGLTGVKNSATVIGTGGPNANDGSSIGGLIGEKFENAMLSNSSNTGTVKGKNNVGGLLGHSRGGNPSGIFKIDNSSNTGNVTSSVSAAGGLVGRSSGDWLEIDNSSNTGAVIGQNEAGGLIGNSIGSYHEDDMFTLKITNSSNTGSVTTRSSYSGGLIGHNISSTVTTITKSSNTGNVVGDNDVGGLIGRQGNETLYTKLTITDSSNTGNITGGKYVGGLVGLGVGTSTITNSHSYAKIVTGIDYVGGIIGRLFIGHLTVNNVYWLYDATTDTTIGVQSHGKIDSSKYSNTDQESKRLHLEIYNTESSFNNWAFGTVWKLTNNKFPTLRNLPVAP